MVMVIAKNNSNKGMVISSVMGGCKMSARQPASQPAIGPSCMRQCASITSIVVMLVLAPVVPNSRHQQQDAAI